MSLSAYALVSVDEFKAYLPAQGSSADPQIEAAINRATSWLEGETNRKFITRGSVAEYHTIRPAACALRVAEWPISTVTSVHETLNVPRTYAAADLLTEGTDYIVVKEEGIIRRISSAEPYPWLTDDRAIKVTYTYGYATSAAVPDDLKQLCLFVAVSMFKESDRARWGVSSVTDAMGSVTRFTGYLPPDMRARLDDYAHHFFDKTWEAA